MPQLEIHVSNDADVEAEDALRSLLQWIREDDSLERALQIRLVSGGERQTGQMGAGFDVLQLVLGSSLSAGSLAVSILQWRDARRRPSSITLRRGNRELRIPAAGATEGDVVLAMEAFLEGSDGADSECGESKGDERAT